MYEILKVGSTVPVTISWASPQDKLCYGGELDLGISITDTFKVWSIPGLGQFNKIQDKDNTDLHPAFFAALPDYCKST